MKKIAILATAVFFVFQTVFLAAAEISIPEAVKNFCRNRSRVRIAVFDFVNTDEKKTRFDTFIADSIVSELSKYPVTLLERQRLELLLREHELSQTGVVDSEKALKLGMLLPVDVIVSGSYTEMDGKLVINGRFVHVGTGEILYAFTSSLESPKETGKINEKSECGEWEPVKSALLDLKDKQSVKQAVDEALKIPFTGDCGKIHFEVMYTFNKHKIYDEKYRDFLINTLKSIQDPSGDNRAGEILRYFAGDKTIDKYEWEACIDVLKKSRSSGLQLPLSCMLESGNDISSTVKIRLDEIMNLALNKKIGIPVPVENNTIFFRVLYELKSNSKEGNAGDPIYFFKKYGSIIPNDDKNNKEAVNILISLYFTDFERSVNREFLRLILDFYNGRNPSDILAESAADFMKSIEAKTDERFEHNKEKTGYYKEDLAAAAKSLADLYCMSVKAAEKKGYRYIVEERVIFILKNKMRCGSAPSVKDLEQDMRSKDWERKLKAVEILSKIGEPAREAEETLIAYLGQQSYGSRGGKLRSLCARTLGNIRTLNPKAIGMLIESFPDYGEGVSYEAEEAINKIGIKALPFLIKGLGHREHAVRLRCAKALGNLGRSAKSSLPDLKKLAEKDEDPYVRKEAGAAVQMINNDF